MKRIAAVLLSLLVLASCRSAYTDPDPEAGVSDSETVPETAEETEPVQEEETEEPAEPQYVDLKILELESEPYFQNGELILYFTNHEIWYEPDEAAYIGIITPYSASSYPASIVTSRHPELESEEDYLGVALAPSEPIPAGTYNFSVTFGEYFVSFEMTVD